jgi:hypothetical protein
MPRSVGRRRAGSYLDLVKSSRAQNRDVADPPPPKPAPAAPLPPSARRTANASSASLRSNVSAASAPAEPTSPRAAARRRRTPVQRASSPRVARRADKARASESNVVGTARERTEAELNSPTKTVTTRGSAAPPPPAYQASYPPSPTTPGYAAPTAAALCRDDTTRAEDAAVGATTVDKRLAASGKHRSGETWRPSSTASPPPPPPPPPPRASAPRSITPPDRTPRASPPTVPDDVSRLLSPTAATTSRRTTTRAQDDAVGVQSLETRLAAAKSPKRRKSVPDGVGVLRTDGPPLPRRVAPRGYWSTAERQRRAAAAAAAAAAASSSASSAAAAVVRVAAAPLVPVSPIMATTHSTLFYSLANDDPSQGGLFSDSEDDEAVQADRIGIVPLEEVVSRRNENGNRWAVSTAANSPRAVSPGGWNRSMIGRVPRKTSPLAVPRGRSLPREQDRGPPPAYARDTEARTSALATTRAEDDMVGTPSSATVRLEVFAVASAVSLRRGPWLVRPLPPPARPLSSVPSS